MPLNGEHGPKGEEVMAQPVKVLGPAHDELVVDTGHLEDVQRIPGALKIE